MPSLKSKRRDFSTLDKLSTEELENILRQDFLLPEEESDTEAILHILEVLEKREREHPTHNFPDPDTAWKEFNELYRPFKDTRSLWAEDEDSAPISIVTGKRPGGKKPVRSVVRVVRIAALAAALIFAGSMCAYALGYDVWGGIAEWTKETFHFAGTSQAQSSTAVHVLDGLERLLAEHGVTAELPGYMPAGYEQVELDYFDMGAGMGCWTLGCENDEGSMIAVTYRMDVQTDYTKDDFDPVIYASESGREYYIFSNSGRYKAVWINGDMECSISGVTDENELFKIIESIE